MIHFQLENSSKNSYQQKKKKNNSLELLKKIKWILTFYYLKVTDKKRLAKISYQDEKYYVIGGIFILPF